MNHYSSVHGDKLHALLRNRKLPETDRLMVEDAITRYEAWLAAMHAVAGTPEERAITLVALLNEYKLFLDLELIFDSEEDFLYRQKGQLKLDNTVIEEFLPVFLTTVLAEYFAPHNLSFGPVTCFSSIYFASSISMAMPGGGLSIRQKDHDFVIGRPLFIRASHDAGFDEAVTAETHLAYVAVECKTNLDKTMFQEAAATALDLKTGVPAAKYYLLCEWLDMTPISSSTTAIDEILVLRKARRLPSHVRSDFSTSSSRRAGRHDYEAFLRANPFAVDVFLRFASHIRDLVRDDVEPDILDRGHF